MDAKTLNALHTAAEARMLRLELTKGEEYTRGSDDRLANFKRVADAFGITTRQAWGVYFHKHIDSVFNYVKTGREASDEPIEGRIDDLVVYLKLFRGIVAEHKEAQEKENEEQK